MCKERTFYSWRWRSCRIVSGSECVIVRGNILLYHVTCILSRDTRSSFRPLNNKKRITRSAEILELFKKYYLLYCSGFSFAEDDVK